MDEGNNLARASGEGYKNKQDCLHGIELVKKEAPNARSIYE
ncbi:DUF1508 domain-containing protein [Candidatus Bathyarchaeota archaeon]|nr:DUF1508 domain-containing protein [Candidatus Bathyarchaeota archaeon]